MKCSKLNSKLRNIHDDEKSSLKKETATQLLSPSLSPLCCCASPTHIMCFCVLCSLLSDSHRAKITTITSSQIKIKIIIIYRKTYHLLYTTLC